MSKTQNDAAWSVWIDESSKTVTTKEAQNAKQVFFESKKIGMDKIIELASKGYKIG